LKKREIVGDGVNKRGLKIPCFVVVCMGNGHFGNSVIFGVVRICRHGLKFNMLHIGMKVADCSS